MKERILITGASGCIGHYLAEAFLGDRDRELVLFVRDRRKLALDGLDRPGVRIIEGDLRAIADWKELLSTVNIAILAATAWGDPRETFEINVEKTRELIELLDPNICRHVIYFSTASILDRQHHLLPEAGRLGTDYIRSKYECYRQLEQLAIAPALSIVFPTLVLGGDDRKPKSHLSAGLPEVEKWASLARWFRVEGSFHFIHARDIASVVRALCDRSPQPGTFSKYILGNRATTADELIETLCEYLGQPARARLPLSPWLTDLLIARFRIQMAPWDRFCLQYRHFIHDHPVTPADFDLPVYCPTLPDVFRLGGLPERQTAIK